MTYQEELTTQARERNHKKKEMLPVKQNCNDETCGKLQAGSISKANDFVVLSQDLSGLTDCVIAWGQETKS